MADTALSAALLAAVISGPMSAGMGWGLSTITRSRHDKRTTEAAERARAEERETARWEKIEREQARMALDLRGLSDRFAGFEGVTRMLLDRYREDGGPEGPPSFPPSAGPS